MYSKKQGLGRGLVQVYTGEGRGKTTAAVGLSVRAAGTGLTVGFFRFFKKPVSGELAVLKNMQNVHVYNFATINPEFQYLSEDDLRRYKENFQRMWDTRIADIIKKNRYDVVILDEILVAVSGGFLREDRLLKLIEEKPVNAEIVFTGRSVSDNIVRRADIITEMRKIKQPFPEIALRKGIDY